MVEVVTWSDLRAAQESLEAGQPREVAARARSNQPQRCPPWSPRSVSPQKSLILDTNWPLTVDQPSDKHQNVSPDHWDFSFHSSDATRGWCTLYCHWPQFLDGISIVLPVIHINRETAVTPEADDQAGTIDDESLVMNIEYWIWWWKSEYWITNTDWETFSNTSWPLVIIASGQRGTKSALVKLLFSSHKV